MNSLQNKKISDCSVYVLKVKPPLQFVAVKIRGRKVLGMIDTGADINCIGSKICTELNIGWNKDNSLTIQGIGGPAQSLGIARIRVDIAPGKFIIQSFVVISALETGIILGLPFLQEINGVIRIGKNTMGSCYGELELVTGYSVVDANLWSTKGENLVSIQEEKIEAHEKRKCMEVIMKEKIQKSDLSETETEMLYTLLEEYKDLWKSEKRGVATFTKHEIILSTKKPLCLKARRFTAEQQKIIEEEIQEMEQSGVIEESNSPYRSEIVLVRKSMGEWRVCIDFRLLNQYTIDDKFPLPSIQDLLRSVRESCYFVTLDLRSGYWQILMDTESKKYTAFRTSRGLKQFKVMPFGLKNAPATFQRMMEEVVGDLHWEGVLVYLDDVLIHGETVAEVFMKLKEVFSRFRKAGLTLRLDKCDFFLKTIRYLGFIIGKGVLKPNPDKVKALNHVKLPKNKSELRSLLGFLGFYRQFIHNYSTKAEPLTKLLKNQESFKWTNLQEQALRELLQGLENQVLSNPQINDYLQLETDASDIAIGAVLSSSTDNIIWKPVEFMSRTLSDTQRRWPVHEREAWAIVAALEKFDSYLRGRTFSVVTDCSSLQWMSKAKVGKISRWASRMSEYGLTIIHRSGKQMEHVDFLSRYVNIPEEGLSDRMTVWNACLEHVNNIPTIAEIVELQKNEVPKWGKGFAINEGIVFFRSKLYAPPSVRNQVISAGHQINRFMHNGMRKTKAVVSKVFRWPGMDNDIAKFVKGCLACQRTRPGIEKLQGMIKHHDTKGAFEKVYVDIWSTSHSGTKYQCLTAIDSLTRWAEVIEIQTETAKDVSAALFNIWISRFGVPNEIITDRGPAFTSELFNSLCHIMGCHHIRTTPRHPEGNAIVEVFHKTLRKGLCMFTQIQPDGLSFRDALSVVLMGYRATIHETTTDTPAFLAHGVDLRPSLDIDWRFMKRIPEKERLQNLQLIRFEILAKSQDRAKLLEKAGATQRETIELGDLVLLKLNLEERSRFDTVDGSDKLRTKWSLPYRVIETTGDGQSAVLKSLLSGIPRILPLRKAHIRNLRFISPPVDEQQRKEWENIIQNERFSQAHDEEKQAYLKIFWESIDNKTSGKRLRSE